MPFGDRAVGNRRLDAFIEVEEAQGVGDGGAGAPDPDSDVLLRHRELNGQGTERVGLLHGAEILALKILDQRDLELLAISKLPHDRGDPLKTGELARPEPTLSGDELVAVERLGHEDRLQDAVLADARRKVFQIGIVDALARLSRIRAHPIDRDLRAAVFMGALWDERGQATAQRVLTLRPRVHEITPATGAS
jgi:hypothetical protein